MSKPERITSGIEAICLNAPTEAEMERGVGQAASSCASSMTRAAVSRRSGSAITPRAIVNLLTGDCAKWPE
jgi:hypothetical protein